MLRKGARAADSAYRPDLYRTALGEASAPIEADVRIEGADENDRFMDGHVFDPSKLPDYIAGFAVKSGLPFIAHPDET